MGEVNFWFPREQRRRPILPVSSPVFFRLHKGVNAIAGYGFYSSVSLLPITSAWECFGPGNGEPDPVSFLQKLSAFRRIDLIHDRTSVRLPLCCMVLREAVYWPRERWIPWNESEGWSRNIVQGKIETDERRASRLLAEIQYDHRDVPDELRTDPFRPLEADERQFVLARSQRREGQGAFRTRLLDAYAGRCAITGEHTEIVLDAAHIQPYLGPRSNHVQNGLLLTKEFHALFDQGYVTVTPEHEVRVSPRLKSEWKNGRRYYPHHGQRLLVLPGATENRPSAEVLAWHGEHVFKG